MRSASGGMGGGRPPDLPAGDEGIVRAHRRVHLGHAAVLAALGLVALVSFILIEPLTRADASGALRINIAGRQRMLSQRISLLAVQVARLDAGEHRARLLTELEGAIELMLRSHERLIAGLPAGFEPLSAGQQRSNILCLRGPGERATAAAFRALGARRIAVSSRESSIRVSPHVYNTDEDVERLLEVLGQAVAGAPTTRSSGTLRGCGSPSRPSE